MIRFINLTGQLTLDESDPAFAFFDTVTDKFCTFQGFQTWDSIEEFKKDYEGDDIERFLSLIPKNWGYKWKDVKVQLMGIDIKNLPEHFYPGVRGKWQRINSLEKQLKLALKNEDYLRADEVKKQIESIRNEREV